MPSEDTPREINACNARLFRQAAAGSLIRHGMQSVAAACLHRRIWPAVDAVRKMLNARF
jgi:hypothetical protein